ncbi:MAG TPA: roadblock/LC7 domain-containing protein [Halothiobacillus sp.]|nr:roadblock/LC7 domain-containing protein [Halothiobacillus sp.]
MREDQIKTVLTDLNGRSASIEASALISMDGLILSSALPAMMDEDRVSAMVAAMLSLGDRTTAELACGTLEQVLITGSHGHILIIHAGQEAVLCTIANKTAKLGLLFLDAKYAAQAITSLL